MDITQEEFNASEAALIGAVRAAYPNLDLRRGTVIRELLIRPQATVNAANKQSNETLEESMTLSSLLNTGASASDAAGILANYGITPYGGSAASGIAKVNVSENRAYQLPSGYRLYASSGVYFASTAPYIVKQDANAANGELELHVSDDGTYWYFLLPVVAEVLSEEGSISQGTELTPEAPFFGFVTAAAYADFAGGSNPETLDAAVARIPAAVSHRSLESALSIESRFREQVEALGGALYAVSVCGYGSPTQLRDKHNPFGVAVGSRVDVYPRTFAKPYVTVIEKTGTRIAAGTYEFTLTAAELPAVSYLRAVSDIGFVAPADISETVPLVIGSYEFSVTRIAASAQLTDHDIDLNNPVEIANSVYQSLRVVVTNVADNEATHAFKVEAYTAPYVAELQAYTDSAGVRNEEADIIVRAPFVCRTGARIRCYYTASVNFDANAAAQAVCDYINSRSFVRKLTRAELIPILAQHNVRRVDLNAAATYLACRVYDGRSTGHYISGDELDLETIRDNTSLLAPETSVFVCDIKDVFIEAIVE